MLVARLKGPAEASGFDIVASPDKGRICRAKRTFAQGEVIFSEQAFVYASESEERCLLCSRTGHAVKNCPTAAPFPSRGKLDAAAAFLTKLPGVQTLDRARAFLKVLLTFGRNPAACAPLLELSAAAANAPRCVESVTRARARYPQLFPAALTDGMAVQFLGVLNCNSHELQELEGSGLFLLAAMMEHDCAPNCSFTTQGDRIWLTAVTAIASGQPLSIDYGNNFMRPVAERAADLKRTYDFCCACAACTARPDVPRAFRCPADASCKGKVHPVGADAGPDGDSRGGGGGGGGGGGRGNGNGSSGLEGSSGGGSSSGSGLREMDTDGGGGGEVAPAAAFEPWSCVDCGHVCSMAERRVLVSAEEAVAAALDGGAAAGGLEAIDALLERARWLHPHHSLVFWALDAMAKVLCQDAESCASGYTEAVYLRLLGCLEAALPTFHHEKVVYYDGLAQVRMVAGNVAGARLAWTRARDISAVVSGSGNAGSADSANASAAGPTRQIAALVEDPPRDVAAMVARYAATCDLDALGVGLGLGA